MGKQANKGLKAAFKLDTVADFIFVTACLIKLLPAVDIPAWILIWIVIIAIIKIVNVVSGFIRCMRFAAIQEGYFIRTGRTIE